MLRTRSPRAVTEMGVAHVPEDRQRDGLVLSYPLTDNVILNTYYKKPFASGFVVNEEAIRRETDRLVQEFDVRTPAV